MNRRDSHLPNIFAKIPFLALTVICASCATRGDLSEMMMETSSSTQVIESRLSALEYSVAKIDSLLDDQSQRIQELSARVGGQSREQTEQLSMIKARQEEINYLINELYEKLQEIQLYGNAGTPDTKNEQNTQSSTSSGGATPFTAPVTPARAHPEELYESAYADVIAKNFELAESRFLSFLLQFPKHKLAPNAQYWLAETIYGQRKYKQAIKEFQDVRKKYPKSPKALDALLKIGYSQIEDGDTAAGRKTLQQVVKSASNSDAAKLARARLQELD